jgi:hypothetical protein
MSFFVELIFISFIMFKVMLWSVIAMLFLVLGCAIIYKIITFFIPQMKVL